MTDQETKKILEAISKIAVQVDMVAGRLAGIAACVAHLPQASGLHDQTLKSALTMAGQLAPARRLGTGESPADYAQDMVQVIASQAQALAALRSAGQ